MYISRDATETGRNLVDSSERASPKGGLLAVGVPGPAPRPAGVHWSVVGTDIHPRLGMPDANRIVSADGTRSIMGPHEMNSSPNKFHYHEETWTHDPATNTWNVDNVLRRVRP
jgi:hypothetical protein